MTLGGLQESKDAIINQTFKQTTCFRLEQIELWTVKKVCV